MTESRTRTVMVAERVPFTSSCGRLEVSVMFHVVDGFAPPPPLDGGGCCCGSVGESVVQLASASSIAAAARGSSGLGPEVHSHRRSLLAHGTNSTVNRTGAVSTASPAMLRPKKRSEMFRMMLVRSVSLSKPPFSRNRSSRGTLLI